MALSLDQEIGVGAPRYFPSLTGGTARKTERIKKNRESGRKMLDAAHRRRPGLLVRG